MSAKLGGFAMSAWGIFPTRPLELGTSAAAGLWNRQAVRKGVQMLGKIAGAWLGSKIAGRNQGFKGALVGTGAAAIAKRGLFPLAVAAGAAYGAKKLWDWNRGRREPRYPSDAAPAPPSG